MSPHLWPDVPPAVDPLASVPLAAPLDADTPASAARDGGPAAVADTAVKSASTLRQETTLGDAAAFMRWRGHARTYLMVGLLAAFRCCVTVAPGHLEKPIASRAAHVGGMPVERCPTATARADRVNLHAVRQVVWKAWVQHHAPSRGRDEAEPQYGSRYGQGCSSDIEDRLPGAESQHAVPRSAPQPALHTCL